MKFFITTRASSIASLFLCVFLCVVPVKSFAFDMTWGGAYRIEGTTIQNPALSSNATFDKSYLLHHVILQPKIVALDGLTLYGRLDIFNNANNPDTQMGDFLGGGTPTTGGAQGPGMTAVNSRTMRSGQTGSIQATHFYLKWASEYGALIVGRSPLQFGLGITYNAGLGEFDHYISTHDLLAYKFTAGNLSFMPMYGKVKEGRLSQEDDINDYMFQFQYENPDSELNMGVFYDVRIANKTANSGTDGIATSMPYGGVGATKTGSYEVKTLNLFVQRNFGNVRFGFETSFANGKTGVTDTAGKDVYIDAYAMAAELAYNPSGKWTFDMKSGIATGDDVGTTDKYEGYLFDRNYDVAFLMFNHKLGSYDVLGTGYFRNSTANQADNDSPDTEYLTNAVYVAPGAVWHMSDLWNANTHVVWGQVQRAQILGDTGAKSLGVEWDLGLGYKPNPNLSAVLESGLLFPSEAIKGGTNNYPMDFGYGFNAKAAVRF